MSNWIGVVQTQIVEGASKIEERRIGETLINPENICCISVCENAIMFNGGSWITVNTESMKHILECIETR